MNKRLNTIIYSLSGLILLLSVGYTGTHLPSVNILFILSWAVISLLSAYNKYLNWLIGWYTNFYKSNKYILTKQMKIKN